MNLPVYQQCLFRDKKDDPRVSADTQRKCLVQMQSAAYSLDNWTAGRLLQEKLKNYSNTLDNNIDKIYNNRFKESLERSKFQSNSESLRSGLDKTDTTQLLKPLHCSRAGNSCANFGKYSESEFRKFYEVFNTSKLNKSHPGNFIAKKTKTSEFKTAGDELQVQSLKKYGTSASSTNSATGMGQKRKLGARRNINSKFVPPFARSNEEMKSDEWPAEEIEKYKNVEPKMVELIKSEIMDVGPSIHWDDIAGLNFAKTTIQEAVVWPMLRPDIFTGLRRPPKGILLFGPPGTGKTLIGKCVAAQSKSTFFSISASSLTSKWVGDGEKMVRALFVVARVHQPAVIFIDEIDSLLSQRSDTEHESSRRIKTEFLVQLDGATTDSDEKILVIGATNRPQELDDAARRRLVKRLYIPLPELEARLQLVKKLIANERHRLTEEHLEEIARLSEGYSGADIKQLCSEASLGPIRSIDMALIEHISPAEVRPLCPEDFEEAFSRVGSSVSPKDLEQYIAWDKTYGSGSSQRNIVS